MIKILMKRFGLPFNPRKEKRMKNKITKHIIIFLILFMICAIIFTLRFEWWMRTQISCLAVDESINSTWIGSLASYWGGIIGGVISGVLAFFGVFYTIKYYKESDTQKERAAIQPFLLVTLDADKQASRGFLLGSRETREVATKKINVTIKNIGNGFANTLVIHTGLNFGGQAYHKVISVSESEHLFFKVDPNALPEGVSFSIQYIDSMRNEYIQEYEITEKNGTIDIDCGYPGFLEQ